MKRFDAVIFDMDGVLIDSEPVIRRAAQLAGEDFGKTLTDELYLKMIGLPGGRVEAMLMDVFGADFPLAEYRLRFQHFYQQTVSRDGMRSKPGIPALLQALTAGGVPIAVATQTRSGHAQAALSAAGLIDYLPVCATGDEVKQGKPAPDVYLLAASRLAVDPARCIALEDSDVGAQAAVSAGMWTLMIPDLKPAGAAIAELVHEILPSMPAAALRVHALLGAGRVRLGEA